MASQDAKIMSFFTSKAAPAKPKDDSKEGTKDTSADAVPEPSKSTEPAPTTTKDEPAPEPGKITESTIITSKEEPAPIPDPSVPKTLYLTYHTGDLFAAPQNTLLIHACNTVGSWGAGIAAAFRSQYPKAYKAYREYCLVAHNPDTNPIPTGTCLLIPPCETKAGAPRHWIGCLFTSARFGKKRDRPDEILRKTAPAMKALLRQVKERGGVDQVRMCKINSGLFAVEWERTAGELEAIVLQDGWKGKVEVWSIEED